MKKNFLIYTPGPVKMSRNILSVGSEQVPYFRNKDFSELINFCSDKILEFVKAPKDSKCLFLSASGTGAMDSVFVNLYESFKAGVMILNSGTFGKD